MAIWISQVDLERMQRYDLLQVFSDLRSSDLSVRINWSKYYEYMEGLQDFIITSLGNDLKTFKTTLAQEQLDPNFLLVNKYLSKIFVE